ncbi:hypothetical protein DVB69_01860 [Sporosarcina sp. BI001-red]|uniref:hypothetical protein n=1 Tax=Sporosarcina sp. BI001-red TaxID=2282866 RepID=UPI000E27BBD6|nr:hypothetical protein [Sporosarcina sp. BI001-red]REB09580.1 hypothetical protein DVB69_01860 [Sporosarcina sp. BI001-red]
MVNPDSLDFTGIEVGGQAAKIDVIGSIVSIIGDSISTYAAVLAIEEEKNETDNTPNNGVVLKELSEIREQLQYLTNEIQLLKTNQGRDSPWRL